MMRTDLTATDLDRAAVSRLWENEECPYFDLVMLGEGLICALEADWGNGGATIRPGNWMVATAATGDAQGARNEGFAALYSSRYPDLDIEVSCGECCASGQNGFVAVTRLSSGDLIWLVFFTESNPFEHAEIQDDFVVAKSTAGHVYRFSFSSPEKITAL